MLRALIQTKLIAQLYLIRGNPIVQCCQALQIRLFGILCSMAPESLISMGAAACNKSTRLLQAAYMGNLEVSKTLVADGRQEAYRAGALSSAGLWELKAVLQGFGRANLPLHCLGCEDNSADIITFLIAAGGIMLVYTRDLHTITTSPTRPSSYFVTAVKLHVPLRRREQGPLGGGSQGQGRASPAPAQQEQGHVPSRCRANR
jgi:hypothetical protein